MRLGNREIVHQMSGRIEPFNVDQVGPCSYDIRLGEGMQVFDPRQHEIYIDGSKPVIYVDLPKNDDGYYVIKPWGQALGTTHEYFKIPKDLCADVAGRSSIARVFLFAHVTGGFIDSGFPGQITLEFFNATPCKVFLKPGDSVGQLVFGDVKGCTEDYSEREVSKYVGQLGTTGSRLYNKTTK